MALVEMIQAKGGQIENSLRESGLQLGLRYRPRLFVVPYPSVLVGYMDDWLKTSASSLQLWEKAPLEPYGLKKCMLASPVVQVNGHPHTRIWSVNHFLIIMGG